MKTEKAKVSRREHGMLPRGLEGSTEFGVLVMLLFGMLREAVQVLSGRAEPKTSPSPSILLARSSGVLGAYTCRLRLGLASAKASGAVPQRMRWRSSRNAQAAARRDRLAVEILDRLNRGELSDGQGRETCEKQIDTLS
jgi:hypothetical protein